MQERLRFIDGVGYIDIQDEKNDWYDVPSDEMTLEQARQAVKDLRKKLIEYFLKQEPKTGHWIKEVGDRETGYGGCTMCSECSGDGYTGMDYCPHCGAKMVEQQESEG